MQDFQRLLKNPFGNLLIVMLLLSNLLLLSGSSFAKKSRLNHTKGLLADSSTCKLSPVFSLRSTDVTEPNINDAKIIIYNLQNATRFAYSTNGVSDFAFSKATIVGVAQKEIEIKNLPNPIAKTDYWIRVYQSATCFTDRKITLEHVNFAELGANESSQLELFQAVDNPNPSLEETVTFSTVIINKGNKAATGVEAKTIISNSLANVYFYADKGNYDPVSGNWIIGTVNAGQTIKLVVKVKVVQQGLSYYTSYISLQNGKQKNISARTSEEPENDYGVSCVTVPITLKKGDTYKVTLKRYAGIKWYYKNNTTGVYEEITTKTSPDVASINKDSSLSIARGGEFTFSKKTGTCNVSSCCPILVESCSGPKIVVDSIYCNKKVDSYNIKVHLLDDDWKTVENVYATLVNIGYPTAINYLKRLNRLPLQTSAGYVVSHGNGVYTIENIPAFMPNVNLVATDLTGTCSSSKIVNAPNCNSPGVMLPTVLNESETFHVGEEVPSFSVVKTTKNTDILWYNDEKSEKPIYIGKVFTPAQAGTYYVAARDRTTRQVSPKKELTLKELGPKPQGVFKDNVCKCDNATVLPDGDMSNISITAMYPNPADEYLNFDYSIPKAINSARLVIYNIAGNVIATFGLDANQNKIKVETANWNEGTYLYAVSVNGKKFGGDRFLVMHN